MPIPINITYKADEKLAAAITEHTSYIARETLCDTLHEFNEVDGGIDARVFDIEGMYFGVKISRYE